MDYQRIYNELIAARRSEPVPEGYTEQHHIILRAFQGTNDADNLIALTPADHFMCHRLLAKIHGGPMNIAILFMCHVKTNSAKGVYVSPRVYAEARENFAKAISEALSGKPKSDETRAKMSESHKGLRRGENHHMYGRHHSEESRQKNSEAHLGSNNGRYDSTLYVFQRQECGTVIATQYELRQAYGLNKSSLAKLVHGKLKTTVGWRCLGEAE